MSIDEAVGIICRKAVHVHFAQVDLAPLLHFSEQFLLLFRGGGTVFFDCRLLRDNVHGASDGEALEVFIFQGADRTLRNHIHKFGTDARPDGRVAEPGEKRSLLLFSEEFDFGLGVRTVYIAVVDQIAQCGFGIEIAASMRLIEFLDVRNGTNVPAVVYLAEFAVGAALFDDPGARRETSQWFDEFCRLFPGNKGNLLEKFLTGLRRGDMPLPDEVPEDGLLEIVGGAIPDEIGGTVFGKCFGLFRSGFFLLIRYRLEGVFRIIPVLPDILIGGGAVHSEVHRAVNDRSFSRLLKSFDLDSLFRCDLPKRNGFAFLLL